MTESGLVFAGEFPVFSDHLDTFGWIFHLWKLKFGLKLLMVLSIGQNRDFFTYNLTENEMCLRVGNVHCTSVSKLRVVNANSMNFVVNHEKKAFKCLDRMNMPKKCKDNFRDFCRFSPSVYARFIKPFGSFHYFDTFWKCPKSEQFDLQN